MTWWELTAIPWAGRGLQSWVRGFPKWSQLLQCPWLWAVGEWQWPALVSSSLVRPQGSRAGTKHDHVSSVPPFLTDGGKRACEQRAVLTHSTQSKGCCQPALSLTCSLYQGLSLMEAGAEPEPQALPLFPFHGWCMLAAPRSCRANGPGDLAGKGGLLGTLGRQGYDQVAQWPWAGCASVRQGPAAGVISRQ